jgi:hypothetical protein
LLDEAQISSAKELSNTDDSDQQMQQYRLNLIVVIANLLSPFSSIHDVKTRSISAKRRSEKRNI